MKYIMVIGSYMMRVLSDWESDVLAFFYSDGAGAAILTANSKPGFLGSSLFADGSYHAHWGIYSGVPLSRPHLKVWLLAEPR